MSYIGNVKVAGTTHLVGSTLYGTCATDAYTASKIVTCSDFDQLLTGVTIHVKFTNSNLASNPTLNVNSTGAKAIKRNGSIPPGSSLSTSWYPSSVISFTYDGTYWMMNDWLNDNTTYTAATSAPGNVSTSSVVGTSTNYARQDHTHGIDLATGDNNGQVKIAGTNVSVKGLGALAYVDSVSTVNGHTINSDVPANAVFTDTTYSALTNAQVTAAVTAGWNS